MSGAKNKLWDVDKKLFESMKNNYISPEEEEFFKNIQYKQEYELSLANDLLLSENDNSDGLYLVRVLYDEYEVGIVKEPSKEMHVMNLSEALSINLTDIGLTDKNMTIFEWLRENNYGGINYDGNFDYSY